MNEAMSFAALSFFTVSQYHYDVPTVCDFDNAPRPHFCMGLILEGKGIFRSGGREVEVLPGELIFVPVGARYVSSWSGDPGITYISMHFSFFSHTHFPGNRHLSVQKISPLYENEFDEVFLRAAADYEADGGCNFSALAAFFATMTRVVPRLAFENERPYDERIERAAAYLEEHYTQSDSVEALAALVHMSVSHFHATFKSVMGVSPIEYRNHIRIRYAIMSLIRDACSIERLAEDLGFESTTYFRRVFKKETGVPPSKYNKVHMKM